MVMADADPRAKQLELPSRWMVALQAAVCAVLLLVGFVLRRAAQQAGS